MRLTTILPILLASIALAAPASQVTPRDETCDRYEQQYREKCLHCGEYVFTLTYVIFKVRRVTLIFMEQSRDFQCATNPICELCVSEWSEPPPGCVTAWVERVVKVASS